MVLGTIRYDPSSSNPGSLYTAKQAPLYAEKFQSGGRETQNTHNAEATLVGTL